jgi:hypothetical protein
LWLQGCADYGALGGVLALPFQTVEKEKYHSAELGGAAGEDKGDAVLALL